MVGQTISHYRIIEKLGEGGMGVVYKAHDTKLDREVALKCLLPNLIESNETKIRFIQEAKLAATLNHPNICTVHDIEECEGQQFIVMEFVDGEDLRKKLPSLGIKQSIDIGIQIAEGLAAAHEKGITHRDLKPENVMLRKDGRAQIMDFGLAKLKGVTRLTKKGITVGTEGYMSPEQVQGLEQDHRSDIFSLGVLLYEMFTGEPPFKGIHQAAVAYEIVNVDPKPMSTGKPGIPAGLDVIIFECLEKEPAERYQSAAELAKDLRRLKRESSGKRLSRTGAVAQLPEGGLSTRTAKLLMNRTRIWMITLASVIVLAAAAVIISIKLHESSLPIAPPIYSSILLPSSTPLSVYGGAALRAVRPSFALSPDGSKLVYVGKKGDGYRLYLRQLNAHEVAEMDGTDGAYGPFFSPDGQWIGFFTVGEMKKISVNQSQPITITRVGPETRGACWSSNNQIFVSEEGGSSLQVVSGNGGVLEVVANSDCLWPELLPGEKHILVSTSMDSIRIINLHNKEVTRLSTISGTNAKYVSTGHLLYADKGTLMAVGFDVRSCETTGNPFPILSGVRSHTGHRVAHYAVSRNGMLAYLYSPTEPKARFFWVDRRNTATDVGLPADDYRYMMLSPDGTKLGTIINRAQQELWVYDLIRNTRSLIRSGPWLWDVVWDPQQNFISYGSKTGDTCTIVLQSLNVGAEPNILIRRRFHMFPYSWSRDGRLFAFTMRDSTFVIHPDTGMENVLQSMKSERAFFTFSPAANYAAYVVATEKVWQVYVEPFPPTGERWQISTDGGEEPIWSINGKELFFRWGPQWKAVDVVLKPKFTAGKPHIIFEGDFINIPSWSYSASPDGQRFLVLKDVNEQSEYTEIRLISNIFSRFSDAKNTNE